MASGVCEHVDHGVLDKWAEHEDEARRHPDVDRLGERRPPLQARPFVQDSAKIKTTDLDINSAGRDHTWTSPTWQDSAEYRHHDWHNESVVAVVLANSKTHKSDLGPLNSGVINEPRCKQDHFARARARPYSSAVEARWGQQRCNTHMGISHMQVPVSGMQLPRLEMRDEIFNEIFL